MIVYRLWWLDNQDWNQTISCLFNDDLSFMKGPDTGVTAEWKAVPVDVVAL